jgi:uncharacterized membrane protein
MFPILSLITVAFAGLGAAIRFAPPNSLVSLVTTGVAAALAGVAIVVAIGRAFDADRLAR